MNVFSGLMNWWDRLRNFRVPDAAGQWFKRARVDLRFFEETHSTNDLAKSEALETPSEITVYIARRQNQGRGRANRRWHDARTDAQLFITWSFEMTGAPQLVTAPLAGLALYRTATAVFPDDRWAIKPPNDLYLSDKKVAGLLVETVSVGDRHRLIIGLGLNVWDAPADVPIAGSLRKVGMTRKRFEAFLELLHGELLQARRSCLAPHLSEFQREELLEALNSKIDLEEKYESVSPFGDLVASSKRQSWRDL